MLRVSFQLLIRFFEMVDDRSTDPVHHAMRHSLRISRVFNEGADRSRPEENRPILALPKFLSEIL